ncbi:MAG: DUF2062 domain-containing protein [Pseudomonadales bacterium]|jgi:hypothetical protein|nr:DUF2062 domain-containing protein [Pseudomonadales bacterium]MDP6316671.1 DUF2062 domain-containing protein [Pseudomonadales bacterium]|tara:strand:- start:85 stop:606 length:522 start_codon:yes stop_codon:yes gene_type:complete
MQYKKYLPTKEQLRNTRSLQLLSHLIFEPNLWHFNRHSVSYAALIGIFCCFLPIPFQMIPCVLLVILVRCNIPLAIGFVWISNPITMPPMMYFTYRVGTWMLGRPNTLTEIKISMEWLSVQLNAVWQPLLLGSLTTGFLFGFSAFGLIRLYWRWKVSRDWSMRKLRKRRSKRQ